MAANLPTTMKALVIDGSSKGAIVDSHRKVPTPQNDQLLIKTVAVALNPTDWRGVTGGRGKPGCIVGCDYAGVVVAVGDGAAPGKNWKVGDRVYGTGHGSNSVNPDGGVFAEYAVVLADFQMRLPDAAGELGFEGASTIALGAITVGQGLFQKALHLELPDIQTAANPPARDTPVLIYGGSTATGALGIQFARRAGYTVITTCSPANFDYVKSLGASHVVDYHDADAGKTVRELTNNKLYHAWDTVSVAQSAQICADALSTDTTQQTPKYGSILTATCPRGDVQSTFTLMYTGLGKAFRFGSQTLPANAEDAAFAKMFCVLTEQLVAAGLVKPHTYRVEKGGLEGITDGLARLQQGKVRAEKLVYRLED
ncbi:protein TOXD [Sporothrix schenckii 1099-18]|uniref:Protein TOXD n=1 Tax=Sporothrix schenckii 1099-18 TaxID=1397361 RepID=A0A0F2MC22_SPOSC|nr:protein TOXD [Sporothrix schenckii 1099-18]KJR87253.1 protein TOXD [Sporothrix schenckii 1099-18]